MFLDSLPNFWTPLFLLLCNFEKSFTLFSQNSAIFYPQLQKYPTRPLWTIPTWFSLGTTKNGKFVIFLLSYLKANLLFFQKQDFFKRSYHYSSSSLRRKINRFCCLFWPLPLLHATFLWKQNQNYFCELDWVFQCWSIGSYLHTTFLTKFFPLIWN